MSAAPVVETCESLDDEGLQQVGADAMWLLSSAKAGSGVAQLLDDDVGFERRAAAARPDAQRSPRRTGRATGRSRTRSRCICRGAPP